MHALISVEKNVRKAQTENRPVHVRPLVLFKAGAGKSAQLNPGPHGNQLQALISVQVRPFTSSRAGAAMSVHVIPEMHGLCTQALISDEQRVSDRRKETAAPVHVRPVVSFKA